MFAHLQKATQAKPGEKIGKAVPILGQPLGKTSQVLSREGSVSHGTFEKHGVIDYWNAA